MIKRFSLIPFYDCDGIITILYDITIKKEYWLSKDKILLEFIIQLIKELASEVCEKLEEVENVGVYSLRERWFLIQILPSQTGGN